MLFLAGLDANADRGSFEFVNTTQEVFEEF